MATGDYGLSAADLETHRRAVQGIQPTTTLGDALGGISAGMQEKVKEFNEKEKEEKEEQERFDEKAQEATDKADIQELNWDTAFDAMGNRGSWASPEMYDNFYNMEQGYRTEYIEAVRSGDKLGSGKMLAAQQQRSAALKAWKTTMDEAAVVNAGAGWGAVMEKRPEDKALLEILAKNDGRANMKMVDGEMKFEVEVPVTDAKGDVTTVTRTVTQREVEEMVVKGTAPTELKERLLLRNQELRVSGQKNEPFNDVDTKAINRGAITDDHIPAFFAEDFGGMNFKEHIKSHPDFKAAYAEGDYMAGVDPTPEDGVLTSADMANFSDNEMNLILDEMEKNPDVAKGYIADWMTKIQKQNWQAGRDHQDNIDREATQKAIAASNATLTAAQKDAKSLEKKRKEITELRKTDIMVEGAVDQYNNTLNLGNINNFVWSDADETWKVRAPNGFIKGPIDTQLKVLVDNPNLIDVVVRELEKRSLGDHG